MTGRGQYYGNRARRVPKVGTVRANKYAAPCSICERELAPGEGIVTYREGMWVPSHHPTRWQGSPVSGGWVGGCPA